MISQCDDLDSSPTEICVATTQCERTNSLLAESCEHGINFEVICRMDNTDLSSKCGFR